jgi:predicted dehydrogenase
MDQNKKDDASKQPGKLGRRDFLQGVATVPVVGLFGYALAKERQHLKAQKEAKLGTPAQQVEEGEELNVALLGVGAQGSVLLNAMLQIPGLRFKAVCDIWEEYNLKRAVRLLSKYKYEVNGYVDYKEMLEKEKDLDAVIIATPDFWHSQHTVDCLNAGLHVYCEKEMSNTLEGARKMVLAQRETGKLLQIGHQRRSHPRYIHCYEKIIKEAELLGRIVTVNGQWNRSVQGDLEWPAKYAIPDAVLKKYGFDSMSQFRNWRWYKGLGGGPIVDLGSHQIDIYNWYLEAMPSAVIASGGNDYFDPKSHEWYDTVMTIFEYDTPKGKARAYYQTQTTNSSLGYYEKFMGDEGTLVISESEAGGQSGSIYRQPNAPVWDEWVNKGYVTAPEIQAAKSEPDISNRLDVRESVSPDKHNVPIEFYDPYHKPHLQNFFNTVRGREELNCPAEIGYETAVAVLKVNDAIKAQKRLTFTPDEFHV